MTNVISKLKFYFIITLSLIGVVFLSIVGHEFYHAYEYKSLGYQDADICLFQLGDISSNDPIGSFRFEFLVDKYPEYTKISKYSELNAYIVTAAIMLICFWFIIEYIYVSNYYDKYSKWFETKHLNSNTS